MAKLELFYPVRPWNVFQAFGGCHPSVCHIYRDQLGMDGHNGIDVQAYRGQEVRAAHDGTVTFAGEDGSAGYGVVIRTDKLYEYKNGLSYFKSIFWHLKSDGIMVRAGQKVKIGDVIGLANSTGMSTGDHLHFGLKPIYQGEADWQWANQEQDNGYKGAIDPAPYLRGVYADTIQSIISKIALLTTLIQRYVESLRT